MGEDACSPGYYGDLRRGGSMSKKTEYQYQLISFMDAEEETIT